MGCWYVVLDELFDSLRQSIFSLSLILVLACSFSIFRFISSFFMEKKPRCTKKEERYNRLSELKELLLANNDPGGSH